MERSRPHARNGAGHWDPLPSVEMLLRRFDYSKVILGTGFTILFIGGGSRLAFGLMLKPMTEDLGWSRTSLSLAMTTFLVVSALTIPIVGRLADRYDLRWIIASGAIASAIGIGLLGFVHARWQVFVLYGLIYAVGQTATSMSPIAVMISRWFVRRRGVANSAVMSGNATGQLVIIAVLASRLSSVGWRMSYAALGVISWVVVFPLALLAVRSRPPPEPDTEGPAGDIRDENTPPGGGIRNTVIGRVTPSLATILASRQLKLLAVVYAICGFQDFFVMTHVVAFALDQGVGSVLAGNLLALMGLFGLIGVLGSGLLADAFGAGRPAVLCFLMRIGIFALVLYSQTTPWIVTFALLYGFTFLITGPLIVVFIANIFGTERLGIVSGLVSMAHQIAGGLGAFVGGAIFDHWGNYDRAFVLMLGLAVVALATTLLVRERPLLRSVGHVAGTD